jgi:hypothetical protein
VRLKEREPVIVMVMVRVVLRLRDAEGVGGTEAVGAARALPHALLVAEAHALMVGRALPVAGALFVGEAERVPEALAARDSEDLGLVPTVAVDVCDAEEERVEDAEPDEDAVDDTLHVSEADPLGDAVAEALRVSPPEPVSLPVPVTVRVAPPEAEARTLAVATEEDDAVLHAEREDRGVPEGAALQLAKGVTEAELVADALVEPLPVEE